MQHQHTHAHDCTHCACNNPVLNVLKEHIFSAENLARLTPVSETTVLAEPQTLMITGGTIRPMIDGSTGIVEAIGISGSNVVVTGNTEIVAAYMEANHSGYATKTLSGTQTLTPGLIEPHVHIVPTALMTGWLDLGPFNGQDLWPNYNMDFITAIINKNLPISKDIFIMGRGVDPALMPFVEQNGTQELQTIDNTVLDGINSEIPMFLLSASMHTMYLNTAAFNYVYSASATVQSLYSSAADYIAGTHGQLQEAAQMEPALETALVKARVAYLALPVLTSYFPQMFQEANSRGITMMYDASMTTDYENLLLSYLNVTAKRVRVGAAKLCLTVEDVAALGTYVPPSTYSDGYYGHAKLVSDGSNQGLTGFQSTPYSCTALNPLGIFNFSDPGVAPVYEPDASVPYANYEGMLSGIINQGWPMMIHANGDSAVNFTIEAYQAIITEPKKLRHRIEHCSLLTPQQIQTMVSLGISPSFLIGHVGYWGYAFENMIFNETFVNPATQDTIEKYMMLDLCNTSLTNQLRITLHSDNSVSPMGPLRMMEQAITRVMEYPAANGTVLNQPECITPEQALIAATYDAAWQCYADQWVGELKEGFYADFVILGYDPLNCPKTTPMRDIPVLETWLGGVQVYVGS
jgi:predicted amidohydrolase YtcJ